MSAKITVSAVINAPLQSVWDKYTNANHITKWNFSSDDWCCPKAENDVRAGGKMNWRMESKDGNFGFDFEAIYDEVIEHEKIAYTMPDGRQAIINFEHSNNHTIVTTLFDAENENPLEMQKEGWQAILNNFKKHAERVANSEQLHFKITINTTAQKVYTTMLAEKTYKEWAAEFNPTSHYRGSWQKGSKILFIGFDNDGNEEGMVSKIRENIPGEYISIEHIGLLKGEEEITSGEQIEAWAGSLENYTFKEENGATVLEVEMDADEAYKSYFEESWPRALNKLKFICENN